MKEDTIILCESEMQRQLVINHFKTIPLKLFGYIHSFSICKDIIFYTKENSYQSCNANWEINNGIKKISFDVFKSLLNND
jgi:hypothetical protein